MDEIHSAQWDEWLEKMRKTIGELEIGKI